MASSKWKPDIHFMTKSNYLSSTLPQLRNVIIIVVINFYARIDIFKLYHHMVKEFILIVVAA